MNGKRGLLPISLFMMVRTIWIAFAFLASTICGSPAMAVEETPEDFLQKLVDGYVKIMEDHGMKVSKKPIAKDETVVRNGSVSFRALSDFDGQFFGAVDKKWPGDAAIKLNFYEADKFPLTARLKIIEFTVKAHEMENRNISIHMRMIHDKYKKLQFLVPSGFVELTLNRIDQ